MIQKEKRKQNNYIKDAFAHFVYDVTKQQFLITDFKRVGNIDRGFCTEPVIHSRNGNGFGESDEGNVAFIKFVKSHVCNVYCNKLSLKPLNTELINVFQQNHGNNMQIVNNIYQSQKY